MKQKTKKLVKSNLARILALAMVVTLIPVGFGGTTKKAKAASGYTDFGIETLQSTSAGGTTRKTLVNKMIYQVTSNLSYSGSNGYCPLNVAAGATVVIYVAKGCKLYTKGGNAIGQGTGGQPGISVPSNSTLIITGEGTVQAVGGNGANGSNGTSGGRSWFNGKKANSMWIGGGGKGGNGGAGAGAGIGGAGGAGGTGGNGGSGTTRTTDPSPFHWNGSGGSHGGKGGTGGTMGNLYVLGTISLTATGGSRGSVGGSGGGTGCSASDAGSGFSNDYRTGPSGGGGGGGYGNAATAIGGGAGGGGGGGGGGTGGCAVNAGYPAGGGGTGGYSGGGRGSGYVSSSGGNSGASGGGCYGTGAAGGNGNFYKASTATVSGRTPNATANSHINVEYDINIDATAENVTGAKKTTMTYGASPVSQIPVPSRRGYTLNGLYSGAKASGQKYFDAEGNPNLSLLKNDGYADSAGYWYKTSNLDLYPDWKPNTYTLICNAVGGSGGGSYAVDYDSNLPTIAVPSKVGYKFAGLYTEKDGKGTQYMDAAGAWQLNIDGSAIVDAAKWKTRIEEITLYAKWEPIDYAIQLYSDGEYIQYEDPDTVGKVNREGGTVKGSGVTYGSFTLPSAEDIGLKKEHYNFLGWNIYDEQNWAMYKAGTVYRGGLTTTDEDVVSIYAAWEIMDNYTISYNGNGGTKVPGAENAFDGDSYTIPDVTPVRTGYTFVGWSEDADCDENDADKILHGNDTIDNMERSIVFYAVWKENPAVTYNAAGGTFSTNIEKKRYAKGATVNVDFADAPHRTGYTFLGWSTENVSGSKTEYKKGDVESFTMPDNDVTLTAMWDADDIEVYYDLDSDKNYTVEATNGASSEMLWDPDAEDESQNTTSHQTEYNADYSFTVKIPKKLDITGYSVYINGAKQKNVESGSDDDFYKFAYKATKVQGELDITIGGAEKIYYSLRYHLGGGSLNIEEAPTNQYTYGEGVSLPAQEDLKHTGFVFDGWYLDSAFQADNKRTSIKTTDSGNLDVYAKWKPITYTVKYNLNGGTDKPGETAIEKTKSDIPYNEEFELPTGDNILSPVLKDDEGQPIGEGQNYDFLGWSTDENASEATYLGGFEVESLASTQDATVTLYAIWATPKSQLSLDANGGKFTVPQDTYDEEGHVNGSVNTYPNMITKQTHVAKSIKIASLEKPAREGYTFEGWSKSNADGALVYNGEYLYITTESVSLYAVWKPDTYEVTFDYNVADDDTYKYKVYQGTTLKKDIGVEAFAKLTQDVIYDETTSLKDNEYGVIRYSAEDADKKHPVTMKFAGWASSAEATEPEYLDAQKVLNLWTPDMAGEKKITLYAVWTEEEVCYLKHDANGGSWETDKEAVLKPVAKESGLIENIEVQAYDKEDNATTPQRIGYTFAGWDTDISKAADDVTYKLSDLDTATVPVASIQSGKGMTLYAIWKPNTYTITYSDGDDEDVEFIGDGEAVATYDVRSSLFNNTDITKEGYILKGWTTSTEADAEPEYLPGAPVKNLATGDAGNVSIILYPVWEEENSATDTIRVIYDTDGGSFVSPLVTEKNSNVTLAAAPEKPGYNFFKWKINNNTSCEAGYQIMALDEDITCVAMWKPKTYYISYRLNNSTVSGAELAASKISSQTVTYDEVANLYDANDVTAPKYTLVGWSTVSDGGIVYQPGQSVKNLATGEESNREIILYAVWKENVTTYISYDANGGKFASKPVATKFVKGQKEDVTIQAEDSSATAVTPTKAGYTFAGWATDETATEADYGNGDSVEATEFITDTTLYAVWTPKQYNIIYDANDVAAEFVVRAHETDSRVESGTDEYQRNSENATYNTATTLYVADDITLSKHILKGWATEPQGDVVYQPGQSVKNLATGETDDTSIVLYAVWEAQGHWAIRYHANGGENSPETETFLKEEADDGSFTAKAEISSVEPTKVGYTFKGWATEKAAEEAEYAATDSLTLTSDLVLYAVWEKIIVYGVSYDANGGAGKCPIDTKEYTSGDKAKIVFDPQPTKAGYQFLGWSTDKDSDTPEFVKPVTTTDDESGAGDGAGAEPGEESGEEPGEEPEDDTNTLEITDNVKLYAVWKENTYTINFYKGDSSVDGNQLSGDPYDAYGAIPFSKSIEMPTYTGEGDAGMVFAGWATSNGGEAVFTPEDGNHDSLVSENEGTLNLYVAWKPAVVNVTITDEKAKVSLKDAQAPEDGKITFAQTYGEALAEITVAKCTGYNFKGIFDAHDNPIYGANEQAKESSAFVEDTTLTAKWEPVTYKVHYEQLGNVISTETCTYDQAVTIKAQAEIKNLDVPSGYALLGWSLLGMNDTSGKIYKPGDVVENNELFKNGSDITLYPIIQIDQTYHIDYNANGGSKAPVDVAGYKLGDEATINTTAKPVKEGYTFAGWTDPKVPDVVYAADEECKVQIKGDLTLRAVWTANEYKISYHNNYGSTDVTITDKVDYDTDDYSFRSTEELEETVEGDLVSLKRTGCALLGWSTSKSGSVNYDPGSEMYQPLTRKQNQTVNLYAIWSKNSYTVTYDQNAPEDVEETVTGVMLNQVMHYDDEQRLYINRYALTGYEFLGWATASDASEAQYEDEEVVNNLTDENDATITLYAVWKKVETKDPEKTPEPTTKPTAKPTAKPTVKPTVKPTSKPAAKPAKAKIASAKNKKKKMVTVKIKKTLNAKSYMIQYATNKKFKKAKTKTSTKLKIKLKKLKKKKKYYIRVCGVNGKEIGVWSKVKKVKIKK